MGLNFKQYLDMKKFGLAFVNITEPRTEDSLLKILLYGSENETNLLVAPLELVAPLKPVTTIQVDFPSYVKYSVTYDDYTIYDYNETYEGGSFRIYRSSKLLDSFEPVHMLFKKQIKHYAFACIEHFVEVISHDEPSIRFLS